MNLDKMINILLLKISFKHKVFIMEQKTYKDCKIYKNYKIKIDKVSKEFKSKMDLLMYLKDRSD